MATLADQSAPGYRGGNNFVSSRGKTLHPVRPPKAAFAICEHILTLIQLVTYCEQMMRVIKPSALRRFWMINSGTKKELAKWLRITSMADLKSPADVKSDFGVR